MRVLISTDSSCLVKQDVFDDYEINVFPLNVIVDGEEFLDGVSINQEQLHADMRAKKAIKTSTPPLGDVIEYFEYLLNQGYDHIIHFTISSKLSSMNDLFNKVAEQNFKGKVTVIDAYAVSALMLAEVFLAYDEVQKGTPVEEIVKKVEEYKAKDKSIFFIPENLNALKNGGRISPAIALIGNSIGIKPVIILDDGELKKSDMVRNVKRTVTEKIESSLKDYSIDNFDYTIVSFYPEERVFDYVKSFATENIPEEKIIYGSIPINVCAHCGPGTIGVIITPHFNGKSLLNFIK